jgi:hypothetical protein
MPASSHRPTSPGIATRTATSARVARRPYARCSAKRPTTRNARPIPSIRTFGAVAHRLCRILFALLRDGAEFDVTKLAVEEGPFRHTSRAATAMGLAVYPDGRPPTCGDGVVWGSFEECDRRRRRCLPGRCGDDCPCPPEVSAPPPRRPARARRRRRARPAAGHQHDDAAAEHDDEHHLVDVYDGTHYHDERDVEQVEHQLLVELDHLHFLHVDVHDHLVEQHVHHLHLEHHDHQQYRRLDDLHVDDDFHDDMVDGFARLS